MLPYPHLLRKGYPYFRLLILCTPTHVTYNRTDTVTTITTTEPLGLRYQDKVTGATITESTNASWGFDKILTDYKRHNIPLYF